MLKTRLYVSTSLLAFMGAAVPAHAQTTTTATAGTPSALQEVVVTAERRRSSVQKTPATIIVRSGEDLRKEGRVTIGQILEDVPNVTVATSNAVSSGSPTDNPGTGITIRGVPGEGGGPGGTGVASTAYYVDGVYNGIAGDTDINRVEVLEGPQGTLYGRSATSGVVAIHTRDPDLDKIEAEATLELGSYDLRHLQAAVNVPLGSVLAVRVAGNVDDQNGVLSAKGGATQEEETRVKLLYQPIDSLRVVAGWSFVQDHDNSGGATIATYVNKPNLWYVDTDEPIFSTATRERQYWAQADWTTPFGTLTYIPAFHTYTTAGNSLILGFIEQVQTEPLDQTSTQEVRFASLTGSPLQWVVGALFYDNRFASDTLPHFLVSGAVTYSQYVKKDTRDVGGFGEATYPILPTLRITGGYRYDTSFEKGQETYTENNFVPSGGPFSPTFGYPEDLITSSLSGNAGLRSSDNITYKGRVEYDVTPTNLVYASTGTGFLPGDVDINNGANGQPVALTYAQEKLTAYEIGSKNRFFANRLQVNGDVFYYQYAGYQQGANLNPDTAPGATPDYATLSAPARMKGYDLELQYLATANDRFGLDLGHIDAYFVGKPNTANDPFATFVVNRAIPGIPPTTLSVSYTHSFTFSDGSTVDFYDQLRYTTGYDNTLSANQYIYGGAPFAHQGDQTVDDASVGWASSNQKYTVTLYVHNIADAVYETGAGVQQISNPGTSSQQIVGTLGITTPRTVGVVLHASY